MELKVDTNLKLPLHHQIGEGILSQVRSGKFKSGELLFTEVGLSERFGISLGPIRQAVNELVSRGILERRRAKGVFLADAEGKTPLNRRITYITPDISHSFFGSMVRGGEHCAREQGYDIVISNTDFDRAKEAKLLTDLASTEPHIVVLCTTGGAGSRPAIERLVERGFIVVMIDSHFPGLNVDAVENDNVKIARDATEYLIGLGHRQIAFITVDESEALNAPLRRRGYQQAMERAGLTPLVAVIDYPGDKWEVDNERRTAEWLEGLNGNYPTACFVISDTNAVGVLRGLRKMNLQVPEDVSVIGCSDLDFARMLTAPLTTINQDSYGMGHTGVQIGIDRREGRLTGEPVVKVQPHRLVERMTTQRPNADENGPPAKSARRKGKSRARSDTVPA